MPYTVQLVYENVAMKTENKSKTLLHYWRQVSAYAERRDVHTCEYGQTGTFKSKHNGWHTQSIDNEWCNRLTANNSVRQSIRNMFWICNAVKEKQKKKKTTKLNAKRIEENSFCNKIVVKNQHVFLTKENSIFLRVINGNQTNLL